jgi:N-hydroxyarylamine O-acetyltransferase
MSQTRMDSALDIPTTTKAKFSLDGYFQRIGYSGDVAPSLETLRSIHLHHAQSIPFENLSPFLRIPVVLDIDSL